MQLVLVFTIQITAFIMTLRRKNIIGHYTTVYAYGYKYMTDNQHTIPHILRSYLRVGTVF